MEHAKEMKSHARQSENASQIIFLVFNRPDRTRLVFDSIRLQKQKRFIIAADGPRLERLAEVGLCNKLREITEDIDWDCDVKRLYRDENLRCGVVVSQAITWFFENVEFGIILEVDCLADVKMQLLVCLRCSRDLSTFRFRLPQFTNQLFLKCSARMDINIRVNCFVTDLHGAILWKAFS
jgi:hypothetical protein